MKVKWILEVGSNHNGSIERIKRFVQDAKELECYGIKFQLFNAEKLFHPDHMPEGTKERELPREFIPEIQRLCHENKLKFICTPFDIESAYYLFPYVDIYKISSKEILKHDLIAVCAGTGKPIIISTGYADKHEIQQAIKFCGDNQDITLLHCITNYPCTVENCALNRITWLKWEFYKYSIGYSDHSAMESVLYKSINLQSEVIEFHYDIDGHGWESAKGHCWPKQDIQNVIKNISLGEVAYYNNIDNLTWEMKRLERADKSDGLRPHKELRHGHSERPTN